MKSAEQSPGLQRPKISTCASAGMKSMNWRTWTTTATSQPAHLRGWKNRKRCSDDYKGSFNLRVCGVEYRLPTPTSFVFGIKPAYWRGWKDGLYSLKSPKLCGFNPHTSGDEKFEEPTCYEQESRLNPHSCGDEKTRGGTIFSLTNVSTRMSAGLNIGFPPPPVLSLVSNPHIGGDEKRKRGFPVEVAMSLNLRVSGDKKNDWAIKSGYTEVSTRILAGMKS